MNAIQRLNYYTSQFLVEEDFQDEQSYHRTMRLLHNQKLHTPGVVEGLTVSRVDINSNQIKVSPGMAIDKDGQEIVLLTDSDPISLNGNNTDVFVTIQYAQLLDGADADSNVKGQFRRTTETYKITGSTSEPSDASVIQLARVRLDGNGNIIGGIDNEKRRLAGAAIASQSVRTSHLQDGAVTKEKIASGAIDTPQIRDGVVTKEKIAVDAIDTPQIKGGAVTKEKIAPGAIDADQIRANAVRSEAIAPQAVGSTQLADGAVSESKLNPALRGKLQMTVKNFEKFDGPIELPAGISTETEIATITLQIPSAGSVMVTGCGILQTQFNRSQGAVVNVYLKGGPNYPPVATVALPPSMIAMEPDPNNPFVTPFSFTCVIPVQATDAGQNKTYRMTARSGNSAKAFMPRLTALFIPG